MAYKVNNLQVSGNDALIKIMQWCAYQERSQWETRRKLLSMKLSAEEAEAIIARLISENFLNEERFAHAFAGGKFRMLSWGRNRIRQELRSHKIPEIIINSALNSITNVEYEQCLEKVINKKLITGRSTDDRKTYFSVLRFAVGRGFESDLVKEKLKTITGEYHESGSEE